MKGDDYLVSPKGARLLDEKVVNDVLDWLRKYPKVYDNFKSALEKYQNKVYQRNLIDDLRLALELLLKIILRNKKRLEKNKNRPLVNTWKRKMYPLHLDKCFLNPWFLITLNIKMNTRSIMIK